MKIVVRKYLDKGRQSSR